MGSATTKPTSGLQTGDVPILALDGIHKDRRWKRNLKGMYDTLTTPCDVFVTGSARLNVYRKGSDSLLGRYLHFRLHPFSLRELSATSSIGPNGLLEAVFSGAEKRAPEADDNLRAMMQLGPFPEPLLSGNSRKAGLWRKSRREIVIREDLRDISRIPELSRIEIMVSLLPERVGSLFSINSVRQMMETSFDAVKRWLAYLTELYCLYEVKPWHVSIPRSLRKEGKIYFRDYTEVPNEAARFENLVGNHLLKACHFWTDSGEGDYRLFYLRNKEKQEIDFLVVRNGKPWLPVEAKYRDKALSPSWKQFMSLLPCRRGIQVVFEPHRKAHRIGLSEVLALGAAEFLGYLP